MVAQTSCILRLQMTARFVIFEQTLHIFAKIQLSFHKRKNMIIKKVYLWFFNREYTFMN